MGVFPNTCGVVMGVCSLFEPVPCCMQAAEQVHQMANSVFSGSDFAQLLSSLEAGGYW